MLSITIPGTNRVTVGDLIKFTVPDLNDQNVGRKDKYLTGLYLVKTVSQHLNQDKFITTLTVTKNGFENKLTNVSFVESAS